MLAHYSSIVGMLIAEEKVLGCGHQSLQQSRQSQIEHFKQLLAQSTVDPDDIAAVYEKIETDTDNPFTTDERRLLAEALSAHSRSKAPATSDHTNTKDQKHFYFHNYMTDELWEKQLDPHTSIETKLKEMVAFAQDIVGLVKPCEKTASYIVGITLCATKTKFTPAEAKERTEYFKKVMKGRRLWPIKPQIGPFAKSSL